MSESGAFEVSYNVFAEPRAPMFFAVWKHAPIKTALLRELEEVCDVTYREFEEPEELRRDLQHFFRRIAKAPTSAPVDFAFAAGKNDRLVRAQPDWRAVKHGRPSRAEAARGTNLQEISKEIQAWLQACHTTPG
jgi:hypothetical protein